MCQILAPGLANCSEMHLFEEQPTRHPVTNRHDMRQTSQVLTADTGGAVAPQQLAQPDSSSRCSAATKAALGHSSLIGQHNAMAWQRMVKICKDGIDATLKRLRHISSCTR